MDVDLIFKIAAVGILVAVLNLLLSRAGRDEQALMTTIAGLVVVLIIIIQEISDLFSLTPPALNKVLTTIYSFVLVVGIFSLLLYAMISSEFNFADMNWAKICL